MPEKITVIHHSADFDGIFCREIARKFLPDAELIGWNFGDPPLDPGLYTLSADSRVYVLDLPCDEPFGLKFPAGKGPESANGFEKVVWIDHHASSIASHPKNIPGYRIDGVAACRLAWQWFAKEGWHPHRNVPLPTKQDFIDRKVSEPLAVRLAGEYDIWDKRGPGAELFQHGLRSGEIRWDWLLAESTTVQEQTVANLLSAGKAIQYARTHENASIIQELGFTLEWEGLKFLACNAARYNSHLFTAGLKPEHDACFGFKWTGKAWSVSLYHAPGHEQHDLSTIAVKYGGGGHRGACGFQTNKLPFL